ncbi:OprO/OprP family phosphate-selective porin [Dokdonella sp.]|uniref:OprO/OprP family phosphate-selective porin n=1 Tax=Dokdonella sp. TaxID=2291710 RepID=UPI0026299456|nr:OprO/OprP family phosphate-selective porin [Dokdonella sp.]
MKLRSAIAVALLGTFGANAMAYDLLNDWPTKYKTEGGYEYGFKGLYQYQFEDISGDNTNPTNGKDLLSDMTAWRRKEFNFYGKTPWGLDFNVGYDFTVRDGVHTTGWIDNFVRYSNKEYGEFRLGQFKTPVGWEETISSSATTFLERAMPVQATNMGRRIGFDWTYTGIPNWLLYAAYFKGGDLNGDNDGHGPAARVVWNPFNRQPGAGSREESNVLHLGLAVSRESREATTDGRGIVSNPAARFRAKPETGMNGTRLIDSGNLSFPGDIDRLGLEAAWIHGPLLVQGEYLRFSASPAGKPDYTGDGYYVQGSWVLTGESRPYKNGTIGNIRPMNDFGAFEVALRYSSLDLNDGPVLGGKEDNWTLGANWYLGQHLKFQANYIWASSTKYYGGTVKKNVDIDPRVLEARVQIYF